MTKRFRAYELLTPHDQELARRHFNPAGRRDGWERIERWAFPVNSAARLTSSPYIEPAYHLDGTRVREVWEDGVLSWWQS